MIIIEGELFKCLYYVYSMYINIFFFNGIEIVYIICISFEMDILKGKIKI